MSDQKLTSIKIALASPEVIRSWSYGEVTKPETINFRSQKPERDGLFCEKIFGPVKDWECSCGKHKKVKYKGFMCDRCGVEITRSLVRRERMGHVELAAPIAHIWYLKGIPSRLALILDLSPKLIEEVIYFVSMIITEVDEYYADNSELQYKRIISPQEYDSLRFKYGRDAFKASTGAEAIQELLKKVDLQEELKLVETELVDAQNEKAKKLVKRLATINAFIKSGNKPEWMILNVLPVIPPDLRPMLQLDGGRFATSDLNDLYRRVISRNQRLKRYLEDPNTPSLIIRNEKRMLQEAVDALIDNGHRNKPSTGTNSRALKSLSHALKGKQGRFRQNLLGKRVDFSGRSVIAVGPDLKMYECGIPREMALQLFKPFIIHKLVEDDETGKTTHRIAEKMLESVDPKVWPIVEEVIKAYPVLLNRAPTLHRLGIQAFKPKLVEGRAIRLHPLVTPAFNADFDGDQMAVHVPLSEKARAEAMVLMLGSNNILGPKDGKPIVTPSQDMVLGNYFLTTEETMEELLNNAIRFRQSGSMEMAEKMEHYARQEWRVFRDVNEVLLAYETKEVYLHNRILVYARNMRKKFNISDPNKKYLATSVGKVIFNNMFPEDFPYINDISDTNFKTTQEKFFFSIEQAAEKIRKNEAILAQRAEIEKEKLATEEYFVDETEQSLKAFKKKDLGIIIGNVFAKYGTKRTSKILDSIKDLGFRFSTIAGVTVSIADINVAHGKYEVVEEGRKETEKLNHFRRKGAITDQEWERFFSKVWEKSKDILSDRIMSTLHRKNPINIMATSGARGSASHFAQLCGMRGLMSKPTRSKSVLTFQPSIIEVPIYSSFREGLNVSEFFISTHGVRKGLTDTALKTAESGYLTRRLVDVAQDVVIREEDCGDIKGFEVKDIIDDKDHKIIETLRNRLIGRYLAQDVIDYNGYVILANGEYVTEEKASEIEQASILTDTEMDILTKIIKLAKEKISKSKYSAQLQYIVLNAEVNTISASDLLEISRHLTLECGDDVLARIISKLRLKRIRIRSAFTCECRLGVCKKCYGRNMATGKEVETGEAVGVIAAQSIGEPGTQLTMRTFHTGGVATSTDITQGLPRVEELFEARNPRSAAVLAQIDGEIVAIERQKDGYTEHIIISNGTEEIPHKINGSQNKRPHIALNAIVKAGDPLTEGQIAPKELLEVAGVDAVKNYILSEVLKVYNIQGIELSDKHIEVMIRQMLRKLLIVDAGSSEFTVGSQVSINEYAVEKKRILTQFEGDESKLPKVKEILLGISKSAVETDSFLSAASFQETTKVLIDAAIKAKTDALVGLKENVIVGNLIPAGTGYEEADDSQRESSKLIEDRIKALTKIRETRKEIIQKSELLDLVTEQDLETMRNQYKDEDKK